MTHFAMPVSMYMTKQVVWVRPDASLEDVHQVMTSHGVSCVPVVDAGGHALGVLSRTDLLKLGRLSMGPLGRLHAISWPAATAGEKMHQGVVTVAPSAPLTAAARAMTKQHIHRVFVSDGGELSGVLSTKELLLAIRDHRPATPIGDHMSSPAFTIPVTTELARAMDRLWSAHVGGLVVTDEEERPVGVFTQTEALLAREQSPETTLEDLLSYAMLCLHRSTPLYRAAAHAHATRARRVLVTEDHKVIGVLTGIDFARAIAGG